MLSQLTFDHRGHNSAELAVEPGLRRIDELLALVLARYERADEAAGDPTQATTYSVSRTNFKEEMPCSC